MFMVICKIAFHTVAQYLKKSPSEMVTSHVKHTLYHNQCAGWTQVILSEFIYGELFTSSWGESNPVSQGVSSLSHSHWVSSYQNKCCASFSLIFIPFCCHSLPTHPRCSSTNCQEFSHRFTDAGWCCWQLLASSRSEGWAREEQHCHKFCDSYNCYYFFFHMQTLTCKSESYYK